MTFEVEILGKVIGTAEDRKKWGDTGWKMTGFKPAPLLDLHDWDVDQILFNYKQGLAMTYNTAKCGHIRETLCLLEVMKHIPYRKYGQ